MLSIRSTSMDHWVSVRNTRNIYICHSRVPLPNIYSLISGAFCPVYASETEAADVEMAPAFGRVEVGSWLVFKRNGCCIANSRCAVRRRYPRPDATAGVPTVPLKRSGYPSRIVCIRCSLMFSDPFMQYSPPWFLCFILFGQEKLQKGGVDRRTSHVET